MMKIDPANLDSRTLHRLFFGMLIPRPIVLVSTVGKDGVFNVAPFASVLCVIVQRPLLCFSAGTNRYGQEKDTFINIKHSKDFVVNFVDEPLAEAMMKTSVAYSIDVDEFKEAGLTPVKAEIVKAPMVAESPINSECKLVQILEFGEPPLKSSLIIGEVVRVHVKDEFYADGEIQPTRLRAIGRLGKDFYCHTTDIFEMLEPKVRA